MAACCHTGPSADLGRIGCAAPSAPVEDFLSTDPTTTWMPIRGAATG
jgi:hypothetical protein